MTRSKSAGYKTGLIGKWGMGMNGPTGEPRKKGFDYSYGFLNQAHAHHYYPEFLYENGKKSCSPKIRKALTAFIFSIILLINT